MRDFIVPTKKGTIKGGRVFIQALYEYDSYANADKVTRERLLFGNWDYDDTP